MIEKVNLSEKFGLIREHWSPKIAGEVNDSFVKLVKFRGDFVWHKHDTEDEMFFVVKGEITIRLRDGDVRLGEGEFVIIPRGVEHKPVAEEAELFGQVDLLDHLKTSFQLHSIERAQDGARGRAVAAARGDLERQAAEFVEPGADRAQVEPFDDDDARREQREVRRKVFGAELLD